MVVGWGLSESTVEGGVLCGPMGGRGSRKVPGNQGVVESRMGKWTLPPRTRGNEGWICVERTITSVIPDFLGDGHSGDEGMDD
eukprot:763300-Hanusia_phi.AAC.3